MTLQADINRSKRQASSMPGGAHDRLIGFLSKALPIAIGAIAAVMLLSPLSQSNEVSFLLDRNKVKSAAVEVLRLISAEQAAPRS